MIEPQIATGFEPVVDPRATRLVLGTMPGKASLRAAEYYAHPQNAFWHIIDTLFGIPKDHSYSVRVAALQAEGVAIWDVLQNCVRPSSLDSDIVLDSIVPNDFSKLFQAFPSIDRVYFNGAKAEKLYMKHVYPDLPVTQSAISYVRLPSTSPANAGISREAKVKAWSVLKTAC